MMENVLFGIFFLLLLIAYIVGIIISMITIQLISYRLFKFNLYKFIKYNVLKEINN